MKISVARFEIYCIVSLDMRIGSFGSTLILSIVCGCSLGVAQQPATTNQTAELSLTPRLIRYTSALPDGLNQERTGAIGITFSIYPTQFDGVPLWSEVQNVQTDKKGGYSALLGSTKNEGLPIDVFNTTESRWLEVNADGVKQPRVLIGSVPYAMVAENAQTLGGLPASAFLRATADAVSSGSDHTTTTSTVRAPFRPQAENGSPGYIAVFTSGTDVGNSLIFQNGSAVSVAGTISVAGTASIGGTATLGAMTLIGNVPSGDSAGMALYNAGGGAGASVSLDMYNTSFNSGIPQAKIKAVDDGAYSDNLTFLLKTPGAQTNPVIERMRITSTGNVGIGTTTPGSKLEVAGSLKISGLGSGISFPDGTSLTSGLATLSGMSNIAFGPGALASNTTGSYNSATGVGVLQANTTGGENTASGYHALPVNTTGSYNTASGFLALLLNTTGSYNTASGAFNLSNNSTGSYNAASGYTTLYSNTTGGFNSANGSFALFSNTTGAYNSADGYQALQGNTTGGSNTASGSNSLYSNTTGFSNTAAGTNALSANTTGNNNTGVGFGAGNSITTGSYNLDIGNSGVSADDHVTRIGSVQTQAFIAGISGVNVSGVPVVVSSTGQLGIASSSRRFKENIQDMGETSDRIMRLRPVTYNYKQPYEDGSKPLDYGLIAEEVAEVYPDLVAHSQDGQIQTVMYQKLTPMLLNEVQRLRSQNASQNAVIRAMEERLSRLESKP